METEHRPLTNHCVNRECGLCSLLDLLSRRMAASGEELLELERLSTRVLSDADVDPLWPSYLHAVTRREEAPDAPRAGLARLLVSRQQRHRRSRRLFQQAFSVSMHRHRPGSWKCYSTSLKGARPPERAAWSDAAGLVGAEADSLLCYDARYFY